MSYKTILVHINDERRLPGLLRAAVVMAESQHAHLIGLSVIPPVIIPATSDIAIAIPSMIEAHRDAYRLQDGPDPGKPVRTDQTQIDHDHAAAPQAGVASAEGDRTVIPITTPANRHRHGC